MTDIIVLTPGDWIKAEFVTSLVSSINELNKLGLHLDFGNSQSAIVSQARQTIYEITKEKSFERMIWIDSDISWKTNDFLKLLTTEHDILSGSYLDELGRVVAMQLNGKRVGKEQLNQKKPFEIAWCGFGFLSLSKDVVFDLIDPFTKNKILGEDIAFCENAKEKGYKIYLDPQIKVTHHKTIGLSF